MSPQLASPRAPILPPDDDDAATTDSTPHYSSFEHFEPGLQFLSNDPSAEDQRHALWHQQQQHKQQHELHQNKTSATSRTTDDAAFVDLLYIVDPAGSTTVVNLTSPTSTSAATAAAAPVPAPSDRFALPAEHDEPNQPAYLPPLSAAFNNPPTSATTTATTTIIAGSGSARALLGPELDLEMANELEYEAKLMNWWPSSEADELKVERM